MNVDKVNRLIEKHTSVEREYGHGAFGERESYSVEVFNKYAFAEAIIKECMDVCRIQPNPNTLNYKPSEKFADAIGNHFGID